MKLYLTYFCFLVFPIFTFAQFNTSIDLVASLDHTYLSDNFSIIGQEGRGSIRFGANFNFRIFEKVTMKTGIRFAQLGYVMKTENLRWPSEIGSNGWMPDPTLPRYLNVTTNYKYIEIPIVARYEFAHNRVSFYFEAGVSPHLYRKTKRTEESNLGSESFEINETKNGVKRVLMGYVVGFGANYNVSKKLQLFVQPTIRFYSDTNTTNQFGISTGFKGYGIEFGIRHALSIVE